MIDKITGALLIVLALTFIPADASDIRQFYYKGENSHTFGTYFKSGECWITAAHVLTESEHVAPLYATGATMIYPERDAVLIGCDAVSAPDEIIGKTVIVAGFPAGSDHVAARVGRIWSSGYIILNETEKPVVTGMSGGAVLVYSEGWKELGVIVGSAYFDHDQDLNTENRNMVKYTPLSELR